MALRLIEDEREYLAEFNAKDTYDGASTGAFTIDEIRATTGNGRLTSAEDMTSGEYKRLLNNDERWKRMD